MSNSASILFCGHSAVIITTEEGKRVVIDPFLSENPICPSNLHDPGHVDLILLTHGHADHSGDTVALAKKYNATVCATYELAALLNADGIPETQIQFMNKGGAVDLGDGLSISLTNAFHSSSYTTVDGTTHYAGEACGIVLTLESGQNIYHAGDTCLFQDMKLIGEKYNPALAFMPIGDRFTMGPKDAAEAVAYVKPRTVIPIHFGTFEILSGTPDEFATLLGSSNTEIVNLNPGQEFTLPSQ